MTDTPQIWHYGLIARSWAEFNEPGPTELAYQWQVRHRWQRWLHVGAQGFGEVGPWDHWLPQDQQSHRAGPALYGSLAIDPGKLNWQAAYLLGKTGGRRGQMFTMRVKYDF